MKILISASLLLLSMLGHAQINDHRSFYDGSYNKDVIRKNGIKKVIIQCYYGPARSSKTEYLFDKKGFLCESFTVDTTGKKTGDYLFTYNLHGDQLKVTQHDYEGARTYVTTFERSYDRNRLTSEKSSSLLFTTLYSYNAMGLKSRKLIYLSSDTAASGKRITDYFYDNKSRLIKTEEIYKENNTATPIAAGKTEFIYDVKTGRLISINRENGNTYLISYDDRGLLKGTRHILGEEFSDWVEKYSYIKTDNEK